MQSHQYNQTTTNQSNQSNKKVASSFSHMLNLHNLTEEVASTQTERAGRMGQLVLPTRSTNASFLKLTGQNGVPAEAVYKVRRCGVWCLVLWCVVLWCVVLQCVLWCVLWCVLCVLCVGSCGPALQSPRWRGCTEHRHLHNTNAMHHPHPPTNNHPPLNQTKQALCSQTVQLVLTAHPTQAFRQSLLKKYARVRALLDGLHSKRMSNYEKLETLEAVRAAVSRCGDGGDGARRRPGGGVAAAERGFGGGGVAAGGRPAAAGPGAARCFWLCAPGAPSGLLPRLLALPAPTPPLSPR